MVGLIIKGVRTFAVDVLMRRVAMVEMILTGGAVIMPTIGIGTTGMSKNWMNAKGNRHEKKQKANKMFQKNHPFVSSYHGERETVKEKENEHDG